MTIKNNKLLARDIKKMRDPKLIKNERRVSPKIPQLLGNNEGILKSALCYKLNN